MWFSGGFGSAETRWDSMISRVSCTQNDSVISRAWESKSSQNTASQMHSNTYEFNVMWWKISLGRVGGEKKINQKTRMCFLHSFQRCRQNSLVWTPNYNLEDGSSDTILNSICGIFYNWKLPARFPSDVEAPCLCRSRQLSILPMAEPKG